jgi:hypothetical protein
MIPDYALQMLGKIFRKINMILNGILIESKSITTPKKGGLDGDPKRVFV